MSGRRALFSACLTDQDLSESVGPGMLIPPHVIECASCRARRSTFVENAALLRQYAVEEPSEAVLAEARAAVLAGAGAQEAAGRGAPPRWMAWGAAAAAALLVVAAGVGAWRARSGDVEATAGIRAVVEETAGARFEHELTRVGEQALEDEVVRLHRGRIRVRVAELGAQQRFRVMAADGEVEVRGTVFDVAVEDARLSMVEVMEGVVVVRRLGHAPVWLEAGDLWRRGEGESAGQVVGGGDPGDAGAPGVGTPGAGAPGAGAPGAGAPGARAVVAADAGVLVREGARRRARAPAVAVIPPVVDRVAPSDGAAIDPGTEIAADGGVVTPPAEVATADPTPDIPIDAGARPDAAPSRDATASPAAVDAASPARTPQGSVDLAAAEVQFGWGWDLLHRRQRTRAAAYFAQAEQLAGRAPLAEDAGYWRALALHDADDDEAVSALESFVVRYPDSTRWSTIALVLAERLVEGGQAARARPYLERLAADPLFPRAHRARALLEGLR